MRIDIVFSLIVPPAFVVSADTQAWGVWFNAEGKSNRQGKAVTDTPCPPPPGPLYTEPYRLAAWHTCSRRSTGRAPNSILNSIQNQRIKVYIDPFGLIGYHA